MRNPMNLKDKSFLALLMFISIFLFGNQQISAQQNLTYSILEKGESEDLTDYIKAIDQADFDLYRRYDERRTVNFDNGLRIELFSAKELMARGVAIDLQVIDRSVAEEVRQKEFALHPSGILVEMIPNRG